MRLYLARHGETESNNKKIIQGQADTKLNEVGKQQAKNLARVLKDKKIEKIYSSDLSRARETAEIINGELNVELVLTKKLRELDMGNWEGKSFLELQKIPDFKKWVTAPTTFDDVRGGETLLELRNRIVGFLSEIKNEKEENILIVSHGIALTTFILSILDSPMDNIWKLRVNNASLSIVKYLETFDTWVVEKFNDFNHNIEYFERDVYNF
jgi:broad specificity phosphatase PhoE